MALKKYIQRKGNGYLETVGEIEIKPAERHEAMKEARRLVAEYRLADPYAEYYLSSRPCANWLSKECTEEICSVGTCQ